MDFRLEFAKFIAQVMMGVIIADILNGIRHQLKRIADGVAPKKKKEESQGHHHA